MEIASCEIKRSNKGNQYGGLIHIHSYNEDIMVFTNRVKKQYVWLPLWHLRRIIVKQVLEIAHVKMQILWTATEASNLKCKKKGAF